MEVKKKLVKWITPAVLVISTLCGSVPAAYAKTLSYSSLDIARVKKIIMGCYNAESADIEKYDFNKDSKINIFELSRVINNVLENKTITIDTPKLNLEAPMILQSPELPTGCEVTTLTMLLNYYGFNVSKTVLADSFMPKLNFYYYNGQLYGADYMTTFPGNPRTSSGYGCYVPCMVSTASNYFKNAGVTDYYLKDLTGSSFESILDIVAEGKPVMVWATMSMIAPVTGGSWLTPEGKRVTWTGNEHCLLLTGYDKNSGVVYVNDPMKGKMTYNLGTFKLRYQQMNSSAACLMKNGDKQPEQPPAQTKKHYIGEVVNYSGLVYYSSYGGSSVYISGTYKISDIIDDESRPYRIRLDLMGWVPYDF
ncbi:MAG: C39 family peptidase [Oscillospiraceae bacterium]|nr:C39 family peptidase [Oscillospiraceae bacterium]